MLQLKANTLFILYISEMLFFLLVIELWGRRKLAHSKMKIYETLSEAINGLMKQGYTYNFNIQGSRIEDGLRADEFVIDEIQRFEGMNDPGDSNILFAISARHQNLKGLLVNAYGA
jgi:hypothetical protein